MLLFLMLFMPYLSSDSLYFGVSDWPVQCIIDEMTAEDVLLLVSTPVLPFMEFLFLFSLLYSCFNACYGAINIVTELLCGMLHLFLYFIQVLEFLFECLLMLCHHIFEILDFSIRTRWEGRNRCSYCHCLRAQWHWLMLNMSRYLMRHSCTVWKCLDWRTWGYWVECRLLPRRLVVAGTSLLLSRVRHIIGLSWLINLLAMRKTRLHV